MRTLQTKEARVNKQEIAFNNFISKGAIYENYKNEIHIFEYQEDKYFCLAIFNKKAYKPYCHIAFKDEQRKKTYVGEQKKITDEGIKQRELWLQRNLEEAKKYVPGAILYSSWGYEQTNIDFYKIVNRVNDTVTLVEIGGLRNYSGDMSGTVTPNTEKIIGEPFKKRISKGYIHLNSYSFASLYDGTPKYFSTYA